MPRLIVIALVILLLVAGQAARFLVVDKPEKSDAIVVLAGETKGRPERAFDLLRQGMAPRLFLDAEAAEVVYNVPLSEIAQKFIASQPNASQMSVCVIDGLSTAGETTDVARCIASLNPHHLLLVTSDYHSRRALSIFSHRLPQYQWSVAAARNPVIFGDAWWTHREWAKTTFDEWTKFLWWEAVDRWRSNPN